MQIKYQEFIDKIKINRDVNDVAMSIVVDIENGNYPSKDELDLFFDIENIAADPKAKQEFYKHGSKIISLLVNKLGNDVKKINELNLMLHATYFQDVEAITNLINIEGVEINQQGKKNAQIRGERPLTVAAAMIDSAESTEIFEMIAAKIVSNNKSKEKTDQGNWVTWAIVGPDQKHFDIILDRLERFSAHFIVDADYVFFPLFQITMAHSDDLQMKKSIKNYIDTSLKHMDNDISKNETFASKVLKPSLAMIIMEDDLEKVDSYKLELIAKYVLLSEITINKKDFHDMSDSGDKFLDKMIELQKNVMALPEDQKRKLREFVIDSGDDVFNNLVAIIASENKLHEVCQKLEEDPALFNRYVKLADQSPFLKPFFDLIDNQVNAMYSQRPFFSKLGMLLTSKKSEKNLSDLFETKFDEGNLGQIISEFDKVEDDDKALEQPLKDSGNKPKKKFTEVLSDSRSRNEDNKGIEK